MMVRTGLAGLMLMATACTSLPPPTDGSAPPEQGAGESGCNAAAAQDLVGRQRSEALGAEALRLTGARAVRWIRPGDAVTMDYRPDRLNIELDEQGRVSAFRCG